MIQNSRGAELTYERRLTADRAKAQIRREARALRSSPLVELMAHALHDMDVPVEDACALAKAIKTGRRDPWEVEAALFASRLNERRPRTYFLRIEAPVGQPPIKVGTSVEPLGRVFSLTTGAPWPIVLLAAFPGVLLPELDVHRSFDRYRMRGEWFRPARRLMRLIEEVQAIQGKPRIENVPESSLTPPTPGVPETDVWK